MIRSHHRMPSTEKHMTLAYAAGASLAAVTLVYVFGPTWFIDSANASAKDRKKGVVGLTNPANDCFINSILQALAGLEDLRAYLVHPTVIARQSRLTPGGAARVVDQKPFLTAALKEILDSLNERPIYRKTISNRPFLSVLERVFNQRISRAQQDAHEFLQVVAETLAEEHHRLRKLERENAIVSAEATEEGLAAEDGATVCENDEHKSSAARECDEGVEFDGIPLEGRVKSEIECQTCGFKPRATLSTFVVLTLPVPQKNHTSLSECIDGALSTEYIDDFQCAKCRLEHAVIIFSNRLHAASSLADVQVLEESISKLQAAIETDPEELPEGIELPPSTDAPRSRIAKCTVIHDYPDIITLHLSRSIFDAYASRKNSAKVSFPEHLQMGGILNRRGYRLLCVVTHKGQHDSGHYECFRRQVVARPPYSTPTLSPTVPATPALTPAPSTPVPSTPSNRSSTRLVDGSASEAAPSSPTASALQTESTPSSSSKRSSSSVSSNTDTELAASTKSPSLKTKKLKPPKKRQGERWWRISDDKIKEASTNDVLDQRKEVYLLFYQRDKV